ncbi:hypothetical protein D3C71_1946350 [compost metagenome]
MFWNVIVTFLSLLVLAALPLLVLSGAALDAAPLLLLFELPQAATLKAIAAVSATVNVVFIFLLTMY